MFRAKAGIIICPETENIAITKIFLTEYANVILKRLKGCSRSLCLDNYPFIGENYMERDYLFDLMTAAKVTRAYNKEAAPEDQAVFGICIQTFEAKSMFDDRRRDITMPEEVSIAPLSMQLPFLDILWVMLCSASNLWYSACWYCQP